MSKDGSSYICPGCGGELMELFHPVLVAAITHSEGCSHDCGDDPDYASALGLLFGRRKVVAHCEQKLTSG